MIEVGFITTVGRLRQIDKAQVKALAESIKEVGLLNPITVYRRSIMRNGVAAEGYGLVAGAHRLEACKSLGWREIPAVVVDLSDDERIIAECDENLCGSKLTPAEQAMFTATRKEAYLRLHPETAHGKASPVKEEKFSSFDRDQAEKTGVTSRKVRMDAERGEKITAAIMEMVKGTPLDTGVFLDRLKNVDQDDQRAFVEAELARRAKPPEASRHRASRIDADVKTRAAREVAETIAEHVPSEWWDAIKANLFAAGANNIAHELTNITGQSIMDRRFG